MRLRLFALALPVLVAGCTGAPLDQPAVQSDWKSPWPPLNYDQAKLDAIVDYLAGHADDCRGAWLGADPATRLDHAQLRAGVAAATRNTPLPPGTLPSGQLHVFLRSKAIDDPVVDFGFYRVFGAGVTPAQRDIVAANVPAWQDTAAGGSVEHWHVSLRTRYGGDLARLKDTLVRSSGGKPRQWAVSHEAWSHPPYSAGEWTLFVPDTGMATLAGRGLGTPDAGLDADGRTAWLKSVTALAFVLVPPPRAGELPLVHVECSYATRETAD